MKNGLLGPPSSAIGIPDCGHAAQTTTMPHHEQQPDRPGVGDHHLTGLRRQNVGVSTKPPAPIYQTKTADGEFLVQLSTCHRIWLWARQLRWMNSRAMPGKAYNPTEIEHVANVFTHGIWVCPAVFAGLELLWRSDTFTKKVAAFIYGTALILLFAVSTFFHSVHYCNKNRQLKDVLHRCDRAMIYIFIAGSYYPWLTLSPPAHPTILFITKWMVWLLAGAGIIYQQLYHERYKSLETCLYLVMGLGPSLVIIVFGHEFSGMGELKLGGWLYIVGIFFFKSDGKIPFAHAIWHVFVGIAAGIHYFAILNHLYAE